MKTGLCRFLGVVLAAATLQLIAGTVSGAATVDKSFPVRPGGTLTVDADIGSIDVRIGGDTAVQAHVTTSGPRSDDVSITFSPFGDNLTIRCRYSRSWLSLFGQSPRVRLEVTVPHRYNVDLKTSGGSISVGDLDGRVHSRTSGGGISLGAIHGTVQGHTSGGSIGIKSCSGSAELGTSGGSINVGEADGETRLRTSGGSITVERSRGRLDAHTSGGGIHIGEAMAAVDASTSGGGIDAFFSKQPRSGSRLSTSGGGVKVFLAEGLGFDVSARGNGVHCDFDLRGGSSTRHALSGQLNGGGPTLALRTSGGSASIRRR